MSSVDLIFPHNENEIAQSRALTGEPPAHTWLHSELVLVGGKKITFADDTYTTLPDLVARGFTAREVRYLLISTHYRQPVHLTDERLTAARAALQRLDDCVTNLRAVTREGPHHEEVRGRILEAKEQFKAALFDDINVSTALAAVFKLVRQVNHWLAQELLCRECADVVFEALQAAGRVLGVLPGEDPVVLPPEVEALLAAREEAREAGDYERADAIREELAAKDYAIEDTSNGPRVKRRGV
jgi:cysteinyl-tRNA synthetase